MFLLSVAVRMCPADSAPAARASSSVAIASHCFPAAIRSLARSFSCYGNYRAMNINSLTNLNVGNTINV